MENKNITSRRGSFKERKSTENTLDSNIIYIATEGTNTEPDFFRNCFEIPKNLTFRVQVIVLPTTDGKSSPEHVWERLNQKMDENSSNNNYYQSDQYWLVVDVDQHSYLMSVLDELKTKNQSQVYAAVSNPCFEVWLAMYRNKGLEDCKDINDILAIVKEIDGHYSKQSFNCNCFKNHRFAISNARKRDTSPKKPVPDSPGTRVYLLVEAILNLIEQNQKQN